jgi:hypothetical protein
VEKIWRRELAFDDAPSYQGFYISVPDIERQYEFFFGVLEIREVYPGTRWDDTCIAEIKVR